MSEELLRAAAAAKHDLGKYVAFELRWLPPEPSQQELLAALRRDLLRTRSSGEKTEDCTQVWARVRVGLETLPDPDELAQLDDVVASLGRALPALRTGELERADLNVLVFRAKRLSLMLSSLHKRLRQGA